MKSNIYWKEECDYCRNRGCEYEHAMRDFKDTLDTLRPDRPLYGTLSYCCDYFVIDMDKYNASHLPQINGC